MPGRAHALLHPEGQSWARLGSDPVCAERGRIQCDRVDVNTSIDMDGVSTGFRPRDSNRLLLGDGSSSGPFARNKCFRGGRTDYGRRNNMSRMLRPNQPERSSWVRASALPKLPEGVAASEKAILPALQASDDHHSRTARSLDGLLGTAHASRAPCLDRVSSPRLADTDDPLGYCWKEPEGNKYISAKGGQSGGYPVVDPRCATDMATAASLNQANQYSRASSGSALTKWVDQCSAYSKSSNVLERKKQKATTATAAAAAEAAAAELLLLLVLLLL